MPGSGTTGTWVDETDIRPTLLYLAGLKDGVRDAAGQTLACRALIGSAQRLAAGH